MHDNYSQPLQSTTAVAISLIDFIIVRRRYKGRDSSGYSSLHCSVVIEWVLLSEDLVKSAGCVVVWGLLRMHIDRVPGIGTQHLFSQSLHLFMFWLTAYKRRRRRRRRRRNHYTTDQFDFLATRRYIPADHNKRPNNKKPTSGMSNTLDYTLILHLHFLSKATYEEKKK